VDDEHTDMQVSIFLQINIISKKMNHRKTDNRSGCDYSEHVFFLKEVSKRKYN